MAGGDSLRAKNGIMPAHLRDLTGMHFGKVTVIRLAPRERGHTWWFCVCDCTPGREVKIRSCVLTRARGAKSCGCLKRQNAGTFTRKPDQDIGYVAAHDRIRKEHGLAAERQCVSCPDQAADWALKREAREKGMESSGLHAGLPFSPDPADYQPMCRSCHSSYDKSHKAGGVSSPAGSVLRRV